MDELGDEGLGARIRRLREERGMKQVTLAEAAGVRPHTMWRYEDGQSQPSAEKLDKIAEALGVTARHLLRGPEPDPASSETRLEPMEDEALSATDLALRLLRPMDPEIESELRAWIEGGGVDFSTGTTVSSSLWALEQKKNELVASRRGQAAPKTEDRAQAVKTELPANVAKFSRGKKGAT